MPRLTDWLSVSPPLPPLPPLLPSSPHHTPRYDLSQPKAADAIEAAVEVVLNTGIRTGDIKQPGCTLVGCKAMGEAVVAALAEVK